MDSELKATLNRRCLVVAIGLLHLKFLKIFFSILTCLFYWFVRHMQIATSLLQALPSICTGCLKGKLTLGLPIHSLGIVARRDKKLKETTKLCFFFLGGGVNYFLFDLIWVYYCPSPITLLLRYQ